jgi:hypothetical protein
MLEFPERHNSYEIRAVQPRTEQRVRPTKSFMPVMLWIGVGLVLLGTSFIWQEHRFILTSDIVTGKVIELVRSRGSKGGTMYAPKVKFTTLQGQEVIFTSSYATSYPGVNVGDHVPMAYKSVNPGKAKILRFGYTFGFWYCLTGAGFLLVFISCGFMNGNAWMQKMYLPSNPSAAPSPAQR